MPRWNQLSRLMSVGERERERIFKGTRYGTPNGQCPTHRRNSPEPKLGTFYLHAYEASRAIGVLGGEGDGGVGRWVECLRAAASSSRCVSCSWHAAAPAIRMHGMAQPSKRVTAAAQRGPRAHTPGPAGFIPPDNASACQAYVRRGSPGFRRW